MTTSRALRLRDERGAAVVEFGLILPVLCVILLGIVEFGRMYNVQVSLTGAAREGARHMAITGDAAEAEEKVVSAAALSTAPTVSVSACGPGLDTTVTATTTMNFNIPFFDSGTWNVEGEAVMRCGG